MPLGAGETSAFLPPREGDTVGLLYLVVVGSLQGSASSHNCYCLLSKPLFQMRWSLLTILLGIFFSDLFFIVVKYIKHKICHLNHFKFMVLNIFTMLYNHHHHPSSELSSSYKAETLNSLNCNYSPFPLPLSPGIHHSTVCLYDF